MSRSKAVTFKGTPLTLAGNEIKDGQAAPDFKLNYFEGGMKEITLADVKGKPTIISVVPSLDTAVCAMQTKKFNDQLASLGDKVNALTVSMDLPFAMNRFCGAESIKNMRVGSDYQDRNFGNNWGTLIEELKIECRAVFVLDANGKVTHAEYVGEVTNEPDYHAAMEALQSALYRMGVLMYTFKQLLAEAIGTFFLCFAGIGAIVAMSDPLNSGIGLLGVALAHGLALSIAISIFGGISGGHHNPAVTLGFLSTGRIKLPLAILYIIFQLVGATLAAAMCKMIYPEAAVNAKMLGIPLPGSWVNSPDIILLTEFICTFLLMTAVYGTAVDERGQSMKLGGFGIGLVVTFDILAAGPVTGASMNPARSFGPSFVHWYFPWHWWCYWVAPIAGAMAAALVYEHLLLDKDDKAEKA